MTKRNYIYIEKTEEGLCLMKGKGVDPEPYDQSEFWHEEEWFEFNDEESLFDRIRELLRKEN